ncbi:DUF3696 domain-containing protein [Desulfococcaceae bacterium HSG8]|nr:DUF3696 domain-containing protein [Desulfococcaceae bacterium HSG8]
MIRNIIIQNFKSLKNVQLDVSDLNLFTGLNGMGKSSFIQVLLLLRQSYLQKLLTRGLSLNGSLTEIGTARDAFCETGEKDELLFDIVFDYMSMCWKFAYSTKEKDETFLPLAESGETNDKLYNEPLFSADKFKYLSAARITPKPYYKTSHYEAAQSNPLGNEGQNTIEYLSLNSRNDIPLENLSHKNAFSEDKEILPLIDQVEAWLSEISPGVKLKPSINLEMRLTNIMYFFKQHSITTRLFRSDNVGFGLTHVLPVIVALVSAKPGELIIIENPETNLHPKGQSKLGELMARTALNGVQLFVETHSDHIINGIRITIKETKLTPDNVAISYFQRNSDEHITEICNIGVDENGKIMDWPDGFLDEWNNSLFKLI